MAVARAEGGKLTAGCTLAGQSRPVGRRPIRPDLVGGGLSAIVVLAVGRVGRRGIVPAMTSGQGSACRNQNAYDDEGLKFLGQFKRHLLARREVRHVVVQPRAAQRDVVQRIASTPLRVAVHERIVPASRVQGVSASGIGVKHELRHAALRFFPRDLSFAVGRHNRVGRPRDRRSGVVRSKYARPGALADLALDGAGNAGAISGRVHARISLGAAGSRACAVWPPYLAS